MLLLIGSLLKVHWFCILHAVYHRMCFMLKQLKYICYSGGPRVIRNQFYHFSYGDISTDYMKKILKIPKGQSESVCRRKTDNTMAQKKYKRTNNGLQNIHIKLKIE